MATTGLDGKGGPWEWKSRVVFLDEDSAANSTSRLNDALSDPELATAGYSVHAVMPVDPGAGEYGREPIVAVLFRRRREEEAAC